MTYLLLLLFLATLTSQSAMDVLTAVVALFLIVQALRKQGPPGWKLFRKMNLEVFWGIWLVVIILGFILNGHFGLPLYFKLEEFLWIVVLYLMVSAYVYVYLDVKKMLRPVLWISLFVSVLSLVISIIRRDGRVGGVLANAMTTAHSYSLVFLTLSGVFLSQWKNFWREDRKSFYLWFFSLGFLGATIVLTLTRGVWVGMFVGVIIIAGVLSWRLAAVVLGFVGVLFGSLVLLWPSFHARVAGTLGTYNQSDNTRMILWETHWKIFTDYPWLGAGWGQNTKLLPKYYAMQGLPESQFIGHAHNQFLHLLAGTGIIGLLCYLFIYVYFIRAAWRLYKATALTLIERSFCLGIFGSLIGFAVSGLTEANFEHSKVRMMIILIWALILKIQNDSQKMPQQFQ